MMDPLETLAFYVREAAAAETTEGLARRCRIVDSRGNPLKDHIYRAGHPNQPHGADGKLYSPVLSENACRLLDGLGLTFAPIDPKVPTVASICMLIDKLPIRPDAKSMAIHAVHRAGMMELEQ